MSGKIGQLELGQRSDFVLGTTVRNRFASYYILLTGENQIDHAREIGLELGLVVRVAPWRITSRSFYLSEVAEVPWDSYQDIVDKHRGVALHTVAFGELRGTEVLADKCHFARILCGYFLDQQTCWVGDVSGVWPAYQGQIDGPGVSRR